jgi:hypothetical protein
MLSHPGHLARLSTLLFAHLWKMGKFGAVGVLNTTLDMGLFWLLHVKLGLPFIIANLMSPPVQVVPLLCNKFKLDVSFPKPLFIFLVLF